MTSTFHNDKHDSLAKHAATPSQHTIEDVHSANAEFSASGLQPSIALLFSLLPRRQLLLLTFPAILLSITSGGIAPYMTLVIGRSFDAFANFPLSNPSQSDKTRLLHGVGIVAIELVLLGGGALMLSSLMSGLWIRTGEYNVTALRKRVYDAVAHKDMAWFDTKMGFEGTVQTADGEGPLGAGGLMANFSKFVASIPSVISAVLITNAERPKT
jgi:ATP-binding cassette subfamily B (MDR/TAP) protein 1